MPITRNPGFQFNVEIDGEALASSGAIEEWGTTQRVTALGLLTKGFITGKGDFWYYVEDPQDPGWVVAE